MKKFYFLSWILGLVLLLSCSEDDNNEVADVTPFNQPRSEIKVYTEEEANYVSEEATENTLVFSSSTPDDVLPQVGSIIQMPITENTPFGFLGRVASIEKGDVITVTTETVPLDEAYPNLSIDADLTKITNVLGVFDEEGNEVEYYIEDIDDDQSAAEGRQTRGWSVDKSKKKDRDKITEFDWEKKQLSIPIPEEWVKHYTKEHIDISGILELSFEGSDIKIDNKDGAKYIDVDIRPRLSIGAKFEGHIKELKAKGAKDGKKKWDSPKLTFKGAVVVGGVVFPITIPIWLRAQLEGDFTASVEVKYNKYWRYHRVWKNWKWTEPDDDKTETTKENPWLVTSFEASGKFAVGPAFEINVGIYSSTTGIGVECFPNAYLKAEAELSSLNPFDFNPEVEVGVGMEWRAYCRAELFGKKVEPFSMDLPDIAFIKRTLSLFPNVSEFDAIGGSSSADISWQSDSYYLLELLGVKTGTTIYKRDYTEEASYYPEATNIDRKGQRHYNVNATGLNAGSIYYAAPTIAWKDWKWVADKDKWKQIQTEAGYKVMWRCQGREDIWSIDINVNSNTTALNIPFEAATYDGWTKRLMLATYDPATGILKGTVETNFYNNPNDRRIDGFEANLNLDDTGYMTNSKVLDNGACYTQIRFVKMGKDSSRAVVKELPLEEDECGLGEHLTY